jgi:putative heme-binding domain-containing protein
VRSDKATPKALDYARNAELTDALHAMDALPARAKEMIDGANLSADDKAVLGTILALTTEQRQPVPGAFLRWLASTGTPGEQELAVRLITRMKRPDAGAILLKDFDKRTPVLRNAILDALLGGERWTLDLLEQVKAGNVPASAFDAPSQARLRQHPSAAVKAAAAAIFASRVTAARAEVIEKFKPALALQGNAAQGKEVFGRACAQCHRKNDVGKEIGPDLRSVVAHEPEKLLVSILDPSASIEPGFVAYNCKLRSGEHVYGIITTESAASVSFKLTDGSTRDVLRAEISALRSTQTSLMPDGLETMLTPQALADLIKYLKTP